MAKLRDYQDITNFDSLLELNSDTLNISPTYKTLDTALAVSGLTAASAIIEDNSVNAPTSPGPLFATINGTPGDDILNGTALADTINGFAGNDVIDGLGGADTINGGDGNDRMILRNGDGADIFDGGAGIDTLDFDEFITAITVNLATGTYTFGTVVNTENVWTGSGNDSITGSSGANEINAGAGQDTVDAGAGNDIIRDTQTAGTGESDIYDGGTGIDTLIHDFNWSSSVAFNLSTGEQTVSGFVRDTYSNIENVTIGGDASIIGDANANVLIALGSGSNVISGGAGNDTINGGLGTDDLDGGDGSDRFIIDQAGSQYLGDWNGGAGTDIIEVQGLGVFDLYDVGENMDFNSIETIRFSTTGPAGVRTLQISGEEISSTEISLTALIDGANGAGVDNLEIYMGSTSSLDISAWTFQDWNDAESEIIEIFGDASFETIIGSIQDDVIDGGTGNDTLNGTSGEDVINGGDGDDIVIDDTAWGPSGENDIYDGSAGTDTLVYTAIGGSTVIVDMSAGEVTVAGASRDTFSNFENVTVAGSVGVIGDAGDNVIIGGAGDNRISGGAGNDTMDGGAGSDMLDYSASGAGVTVNLAASTASGVGSDADGDIISNFENVIGSNFDDVLTSAAGAFGTVYGGAGNDIINSGDNISGDILNGGSGDDIITSAPTMGGTTLNGDAGNDELYASTDGIVSGDIANGGTGDDLIGLISNVWNQVVDGGTGTDTLSLSSLSGGYDIDMTTGQVDDGGGLDNATFSNIENIVGSIGADTITGDGNANVIWSAGGIDTVDAGAGNDTIIGAASSGDFTNGEVYDGGAGIDSFVMQDYTLTLAYTVDLAAGTFSNTGGSAVWNMTNFENFDGSTMTNTNTLTIFGTSGVNILSGTMGADDIFGGGANDILNGGGGLDTLEGGAGADAMDGGVGNDTLEYGMSNASVNVNLETGAASGGHATGDTFSNMEGIRGSLFNDILTGDGNLNFLFGNDGNDRLEGGAGNDEMFGGEGADTLFGGAGADVNNGGNGFDSVDYRAAISRVVLNLGTGGTLGDAAGDTYFSIERVYGTDFNDTITGTAANEFFYGEDGNDTINAGDGIDRVYGGNGNDIQRGDGGNDQLYGSAGNDQLNGGTGFDIANYRDATSAVSLNLGSGGILGDAAGDTYFGIEAVYGSDFNDILAGNNSANELRGWDGNDILNGAGGNDRLFGGAGADALNGGTGVDIAVYTDAASGVTVNLATVGTVGDAAGDTYSSIEWVWGSDFNDIITGDTGANRLEGRDGNDTLNGGDGNDRLIGGEGDDTINGGNGVDTIFGQNGNDNLIGAGGNDFFFGSAGGDSISGGLDFDTVSYLASTSGVDVNLLSGGTGGDAAGDTYTSIERVFGSQFVDAIIGDNGANTLLGNGGDDYVNGGLGNDSLFGGAGTDSYGYDTTNADADVINGFSTAGEIIYILGGDTDFDTWAELQAVGTDAGANVIFDFGGGNTLTIVGQNLADLDAADFDFGGVPPAAEPLDDGGAFASEPLTFDEVMAIHQAFAAEANELQLEDALI